MDGIYGEALLDYRLPTWLPNKAKQKHGVIRLPIRFPKKTIKEQTPIYSQCVLLLNYFLRANIIHTKLLWGIASYKPTEFMKRM